MFPECVGCGYCCLKTMCAVAVAVHGEVEERCPFLHWTDDRYRCGLVGSRGPQLAIGEGCSSSLNTWRREVRFRG